jgi:hypothetical protein
MDEGWDRECFHESSNNRPTQGENIMTKRYLKISTPVIGFCLFYGFLLTGYIFGADTSLEAKIKELQQSIKVLEQKATRAQDVIDIQNLQGRYEAIHNAQEWLAYKLFANRPDTTFEITFAKKVGYEAIKEGYLNLQKMNEGGGAPRGGSAPAGGASGGTPPAGNTRGGTAPAGGAPSSGAPGGGTRGGSNPTVAQRIHPIGTPVIVVADDGQTAKATFTSLGFEGNAWCYGKYTNSYIKINGKWYIWHMKWNRMFMTDYYKSWSDQTLEEIQNFTAEPGIDNRYLMVPGKKAPTLTSPQPYKTWTKEDEDGGWYKKETVEP